MTPELQQILKTLRLLSQSQLGHEGRYIQDSLKKKFNIKTTNTIVAGISQIGSLASNGVLPGQGGFILPVDDSHPHASLNQASSPSDLRRIFVIRPTGMTPEEEDYLVKAAEEGGNVFPKNLLIDASGKFSSSSIPAMNSTTSDALPTKLITTDVPNSDKSTDELGVSFSGYQSPTLPVGYQVKISEAQPLHVSRESKVPASRISRLANFGLLAIGLSSGAAVEYTKRAFGLSSKEDTTENVVGPSNPFLTPANAERIVQTLCRVRGAALKLGQMLSIQDEEMVPKYLLDIFERVRQSADSMPQKQVDSQMSKELGTDWRTKFLHFEDKPFAAASIGQVHRARTLDNKLVAVKIQYPGVAEGIDADIDNLVSILNMGGLFPDRMFLGNFVKIARKELKAECDYEREARAVMMFRRLLKDDKSIYIPGVFRKLSSKKILTTELVEGTPIDKCESEPQQVRDYIAGKFIENCLNEIFMWRFMQTDPNWSNFFLGKHPETGEPRLILLDFGASRSYSKKFVDQYMHIIKAAYDKDRKKMLEYSKSIGFLTGYESKVMQDAHCDSIEVLGEILASREPYDFARQSVTRRIKELIPVMLEHRLTSPPEEVYSLHRKLSGGFLIASKLKAKVACGLIFEKIYLKYEFGEGKGATDIDIDHSKML